MSESTATFAATMKKVFGEGQTPTQFMTEFKRLSPEDKLYFHKILNAEGYSCSPPSQQ